MHKEIIIQNQGRGWQQKVLFVLFTLRAFAKSLNEEGVVGGHNRDGFFRADLFPLVAPEIDTGELRTADIGTEVFFLPAAAHTEKNGSFTNTQRLLQWRDKALDPPGDARSELWFMYHLGKRVRAHYADSTAERDWPMRAAKRFGAAVHAPVQYERAW